MTKAPDESGYDRGHSGVHVPEQVRAKELDARTDLFSFGAVLYEMATGELPFRGDTRRSCLKRSCTGLRSPPVRLNPDLPAKLEEIINNALEKDRELRYQHASDIRAELQAAKAGDRIQSVARGGCESGSAAVATGTHSVRCQRQTASAVIGCTDAIVIAWATTSGRGSSCPVRRIDGGRDRRADFYFRSRPATR